MRCRSLLLFFFSCFVSPACRRVEDRPPADAAPMPVALEAGADADADAGADADARAREAPTETMSPWVGGACPEPFPSRWRGVSAPSALAGADGFVCAFHGDERAWIAMFARADATPMHVVVLRTSDGGATWQEARLGRGEPSYTSFALSPELDLRFDDASHGEVHVVDLAQHQNGHRRTEAWFTTKDGGKTWRLLRSRTNCYDRAHGCQAG